MSKAVANVPQMSKEEKRNLMIECQMRKFEHALCKDLLLGTGKRQLVEGPSRGNGRVTDLWSRGPNGGQNLCGECLMEVRTRLMRHYV